MIFHNITYCIFFLNVAFVSIRDCVIDSKMWFKDMNI